MARTVVGTLFVLLLVGCGASPPPRAILSVSGALTWSVCHGSNDDSAAEVALVAASGERITVGPLYESCHMVMLDGDPAVSCDDVHSDRRGVARVIRGADTIAVVHVEMMRPEVEDDADSSDPPAPRVVGETTVGTLRLPRGTAIGRASICARAPEGR